jgi:hypothetical protein
MKRKRERSASPTGEFEKDDRPQSNDGVVVTTGPTGESDPGDPQTTKKRRMVVTLHLRCAACPSKWVLMQQLLPSCFGSETKERGDSATVTTTTTPDMETAQAKALPPHATASASATSTEKPANNSSLPGLKINLGAVQHVTKSKKPYFLLDLILRETGRGIEPNSSTPHDAVHVAGGSSSPATLSGKEQAEVGAKLGAAAVQHWISRLDGKMFLGEQIYCSESKQSVTDYRIKLALRDAAVEAAANEAAAKEALKFVPSSVRNRRRPMNTTLDGPEDSTGEGVVK